MFRKSILVILTLMTLLIFAACAGTAPEASQEAVVTTAPTEAAAEAPSAAAEEAVAEESSAESTDAAQIAVYTVDTTASVIEWFGSKPIGASESGTVAISDGQLHFNGTELLEGSFVIDMNSIETTTQSGNMKNMLEDHLKSDDFFGVANYPTANLVIKSVTPTEVANQYAVVADLTLKETTDEIEFLTDVVVVDNQLEAVAEIVVDRAIYDVQYGSGAFFSNLGDDLISDEMELTVNLVARS
ncbi:MAG: YceI family protein [Caldilineaceae bacterium]|nr:YceI family protein [Caldilineaceae bacterium]